MVPLNGQPRGTEDRRELLAEIPAGEVDDTQAAFS
jgi:hypothetical protein